MSSRHARRSRRCVYVAETLEARRLLATINGTPNVDQIVIDFVNNQTAVTVNGATTFYPSAEPITVESNAGADRIDVRGSGTGALQLNNGFTGLDAVTLGNGDFLTNVRASNIGVNGGPSRTRVTLDNTAVSSLADVVYDIATPNMLQTTVEVFTAFFGTSPRKTVSMLSTFAIDIRGGQTTDSFYFGSRFAVPTGVICHGNGGDDRMVIDDYDAPRRDLTTTLADTATFNGGPGRDTLSVDDGNAAAGTPRTYILTQAEYSTSPALGRVFHTGLEAFTQSGSNANNELSLQLNPNATSTIGAILFDGRGGDDAFETLGPVFRDFGDVALTLVGGAGNDALDLFDSAPGAATQYFLTPGLVTFTDAGNPPFATVSYDAWETMSLTNGADRSTFTLRGFDDAVAAATLNGGAGDDLFDVGGDLDDARGTAAGLAGRLRLNGDSALPAAPGFDSLVVTDFDDETGGTAVDLYGVAATRITKGPAATPAFDLTHMGLDLVRVTGSNSPSNYAVGRADVQTTIGGGSGFDTFRATVTGANPAVPLVLRGNGNVDSFDLIEGVVTIRGGAANDSVTVNADGTGSAGFVVDENEDWGSLRIYKGGTGTLANLAGDVVVATNAFDVLRGTLDLNDNALIVRSPEPVPDYVARIARGHADGTWAGTPDGNLVGVMTSGVARATPIGDGLGYATIGTGVGQLDRGTFGNVAVTAGNFVVGHTLYGDADLDGTVGFNDLVSLAQNYNATDRNWVQGDFDYDAAVGFPDLVALAQNYGQSTPATLAGTGRRRGVAADVIA